MKKLHSKEFSDYIKSLKLITINNSENNDNNIEIDDISIIDNLQVDTIDYSDLTIYNLMLSMGKYLKDNDESQQIALVKNKVNR